MVEQYLKDYTIIGQDLNRPWGQFYYIHPHQITQFSADYFSLYKLDTGLNLSPKILVINPGNRLSYQYHNRRKEIWSVLVGPVGIITSLDDTETPMKIVNTGDIITIDVQERHRLVGLTHQAMVAEIWVHTDIDHPSDEADIIRLQDDYQR